MKETTINHQMLAMEAELRGLREEIKDLKESYEEAAGRLDIIGSMVYKTASESTEEAVKRYIIELKAWR